MTNAAPRVAAVTGGSAGIGKAICEDLLAQGYEVVSLARRRSDIDDPKLHSIEVDLADRAATAQAVADLVRRFDVTTVVHNAGVIRPALLADVKLDDLDALVDLHLGCAIQLVQATLPTMRAQRSGRVVLLSSRAGTKSSRSHAGAPTSIIRSCTASRSISPTARPPPKQHANSCSVSKSRPSCTTPA